MIPLLKSTRNCLLCCLAVCVSLAMIDPASGVWPENFADYAEKLEAHSPPLKKAGQGGFFNPNFRSSDQNKSPSIPLFQRGKPTRSHASESLDSESISNAQSFCIELTSDTGVQRSVPINVGSTMRLSFRHSVFGSRVEELFALRRDGFQLTQLRYAEARLVDFYGHENAKYQNGAWVVSPTPALHPSLNLILSADAAMSVHFDRPSEFKPLAIQPGGALRLTIASCKSSAHG